VEVSPASAGSGSNVVSLGEGGTPLVGLPGLAARLGIRVLFAKAEHMNPTGSFKDRIASMAMSIVLQRGLAGCLGTSSGNGGAAVAAYAARAGRRALLFTMTDIPAEKLRQIRATVARVFQATHLGSDRTATREIADQLHVLARSQGFMPFITAFQFMSEAMQGAKTIAFELAR
jgi:threonine synthase